MDWQLVAVGTAVVAAVAFVGWSAYRTWFGTSKSGCGSGCGKCPSTAVEPPATAPGRIRLPLA